ncbi:single-stranded DNA-binding protein [Melioribacteraceae bacterium 4301-Me]|uniref:single-stranded DNA-binding protein n=1 Tax=Pyranulibacter aquaticus TaxID=3163344 RepID=UPI0035978D0E
MALSLNKVMLIGNLGNDAETRFTPNNVSVTTFSLATNRSYKGKDGNWVNETTWHNIVCYNLPDSLKELLKKGKKFYIEGRISKRDYTDKDKIKRYFTEIISERLIPLDSKDVASENIQTYEQEGDVDVEATDADNDLPF